MSHSSNKRAAYTRQQFLKSKRWSNIEKDMLSIVLSEDQSYTIEEAQTLLNNFGKRKVD